MAARKDFIKIIVESPSCLLKHYMLQNRNHLHFYYHFNPHFQEGKKSVCAATQLLGLRYPKEVEIFWRLLCRCHPNLPTLRLFVLWHFWLWKSQSICGRFWRGPAGGKERDGRLRRERKSYILYYLMKGVEIFMGVMGGKQSKRAKKTEKKREGKEIERRELKGNLECFWKYLHACNL